MTRSPRIGRWTGALCLVALVASLSGCLLYSSAPDCLYGSKPVPESNLERVDYFSPVVFWPVLQTAMVWGGNGFEFDDFTLAGESRPPTLTVYLGDGSASDPVDHVDDDTWCAMEFEASDAGFGPCDMLPNNYPCYDLALSLIGDDCELDPAAWGDAPDELFSGSICSFGFVWSDMTEELWPYIEAHEQTHTPDMAIPLLFKMTGISDWSGLTLYGLFWDALDDGHEVDLDTPISAWDATSYSPAYVEVRSSVVYPFEPFQDLAP